MSKNTILSSGFKWLICLLFVFGFYGNAFGVWKSFGGEIYYQYTGGSTYRVFGVNYTECNGIPKDTVIFHITDGNTSKAYSTHKCCTSYYNQGIAAGQCTRCPNNPACTFPYGVKFDTYYADVDVSAFSSCTLTISWDTCCLYSSITTGGANEPFYISAILNRCNGDHSSPQFQESPVMLISYKKVVDLYQTVTPANNNDSIVYRFVYPTSAANTKIPYQPGYDYNFPFMYEGTSPVDKKPGGFHYFPTTGELCFTPEKTDISIIALEADEYAKNKSGVWYLAGNTLRTTVTFCIIGTNLKNTPQIAGIAGVKNDTLYTCAGVPLTLQFTTNDPGNKHDTMTITNVVNETSGNISYSSGSDPTATLYWTPVDSNVSSAPYKVIMMASDDGVPLNNFVESTLYIYVLDSMPDDSIIPSTNGCGIYTFGSKNKRSKGQTFTWFADGKTISNTDSAFYTFPFNGIHTVQLKVNNALGCEWDFYDTLDIKILPNVLANGGNIICQGSGTPLTAKGALKYSWFPTTGLASDTGSNVYASPISTTTYFVTGTDGNGCEATDSLSVMVEIINSRLNPDTIICLGQIAYIKGYVNDAKSYVWTSKSGTIISDSAAMYFKLVSDTQYVLTVADSFGCKKTFSGIIHSDFVKPNVISKAVSVCFGDSVKIQASGGTHYYWPPTLGLLPGASTAAAFVKPATKKYFYVSVSDSAECSAVDSVLVIVSAVYQNPNRQFSICEGNSLSFSASGGKTYSWSPAVNINNIHIANPTVNPDTSTTYVVTVCDTLCGCFKKDSFMVTVFPFVKISAGADMRICQGQSASIGAKAMADYDYSWTSLPKGYASTKATDIVSPKTPTTYILDAQNINSGCKSIDSVKITVDTFDTEFTGAQFACEGDTDAYSLAFYNKINTYTWKITGGRTLANDKNSAAIIWDSPGKNSVTLIEEVQGGKCKDSSSMPINITAIPTANIYSKNKICIGNSISFVDSGSAADFYHWHFGDGDTSDLRNPVYMYKNSGFYHVSLLAANGQCGAIDTETIEVFNFPFRSPIVSHTGFREYLFDNNDSADIIYSWTSGDGDTLKFSNISHVYADTGLYKIIFDYGYPWGCPQSFDTVIHVIDELPPPPPHYIDSVHVGPNPFIDHISFSFSHSTQESIQITLYDALGRLISQKDLDNQVAGSYSYSFQAWQVSNGMYFLKYQAGGKTMVFKMIKI